MKSLIFISRKFKIGQDIDWTNFWSFHIIFTAKSHIFRLLGIALAISHTASRNCSKKNIFLINNWWSLSLLGCDWLTSFNKNETRVSVYRELLVWWSNWYDQTFMLTELVSRHKIVHTLYVDFRQCFHLIVFKTSVTAVFPSGQCINVARKLDKADVTDHTTNR